MLGADVLGDDPAGDNFISAGEIAGDRHRVHESPFRGGEFTRIVRHGFERRLETFPIHDAVPLFDVTGTEAGRRSRSCPRDSVLDRDGMD